MKRPIPFPASRVRGEQSFDLVRRFQAERERAATAVPALLRRTPLHAWPSLAEHPDVRNGGAAERLRLIVAAELTVNPTYALDVAMLAVSVAEALQPGTYPDITLVQLRTLAWNDLGKTYSFLARHDEAIAALSRGELDLDQYPVLAHERAVIHLNLSLTYQEIGRHDEALELIVASKKVFRDFGDHRLRALAGFYEGVLQQRLARYREARETYLLLIASATEIDKDTLAALHHTIGFCSIELGDFDDAEANLVKAIAMHTELRQPLEAAKGELGRGRLYVRRGWYERGVEHLQVVRRQFLRQSLAEEAGLCGLDMVEGLLHLGRSEQAEALARTIMNEFLAARLNTRAITALGYLSEAIAARTAFPSLAANVREYVLSLRVNPEREFDPPRLPLTDEA